MERAYQNTKMVKYETPLLKSKLKVYIRYRLNFGKFRGFVCEMLLY